MQECKDAEPDVLFVGDSMVQLMQQHEVIVISLISQSIKKENYSVAIPFAQLEDASIQIQIRIAEATNPR